MILNYIKIALRIIRRQKFYSFINIAGLTIGLVTSLSIVLYVIDEFSYDKFHKDSELIYRVNLTGRMANQEFQSLSTPAPLAASIISDIPGVDKTCRIAPRREVMIKNDDDDYLENTVLFADSCFFDFFSFRLITGEWNTVLSKPYNVVLTESAAKRIFGYKGAGDNSPIGKTLEYGTEKWTCTVTGIVSDPPPNSHFHFNMILSMSSWANSRSAIWVRNSLLTYIKLNRNTEKQYVESKLSEIVKKYIGPQAQSFLGVSFDEFLKQGGAYGFFLQAIRDIHFSKNPDLHLEPGGNKNTIYLLIGIAIFIIIIASINFMNLSTARFSGRAKEVGIRKSMGGQSSSIKTQFLFESISYTLIALILAHLVLALILPRFNNLAGKILNISSLSNFYYLASVLILVIVVGILAGSYPAFYLTSFKPVDVLRGTLRAGMKSKGVRRILVVFQFTLSTSLIICTHLVFRQLGFLKDADKGFDSRNLMAISIQSLGDKITFKEELLKMPEVVSASICDMAPPDAGGRADIFRPKGQDDQKRGSNFCFVDEDMTKTLKLSMAEGRFFSRDYPSDSRAIVLNEAAVKAFGLANPIGQIIQSPWKINGVNEWEVIGVVKDYNYQSLQEKITSFLLFPGQGGNKMLVRLAPGEIKSQIEKIKKKWESFPGSGYFDYSFVSDNFFARFSKEQQLSKVFIVFTLLTILVASLGLIGLATFSAEQRSKEIGIRKAMGASSSLIVNLMSWEYLSLVFISFIVAVPLSFLVISWWLKNFAYKTSIGPASFIAGGVIAVLIAVVSVSYQSLKAAFRNPVTSLKYE